MGKTLNSIHVVNFKLYDRIQKALTEKDVENVYRELFHIALPDSDVTSPYGCDGVLKSVAHDLVALMEFKYDYDFTKRWVVCDVLVQCVYYLKKFSLAGDVVPRVLFVGDINECFCLSVSALEKYLSRSDVNWAIAPSSASKSNSEMVKSLYEDEDVVPYVWNIRENAFNQIIDKMLDMNNGIVRHVAITEANISRIFNSFYEQVITDSRYKGKGDKSVNLANELVGMFIGILTQPDQFYLHPTKTLRNNLMTPSAGMVKVDHKAFSTFFNHFQSEYSPSERERLVSICDRLIDDTKRRWDGAFFTPTHWVNEAHSMLDAQLGPDWRDEYVVWDCCCGTGNLTRDYRFKELYCSTLIADELQLGGKYNPEAIKFQYDFLSEIGIDGLPPEADGLKKAFAEGKKVLFLVNPPYGTANNAGTKEGDHKAGISKTVVAESMKDCGASRQQLSAQFMHKMAELGGTVAIFNSPLFLTGGSYAKFRRFWMERYRMSDGMLFQAAEFADVSGQWGILFSIWKHGKDDRNEWTVFLKRSSDDLEYPIEAFGEKVLYNLDERKPASKWVREETKGMKTHDAPQVASALVVKQSGRGMSIGGHSLGYLLIKGNTPYENGTGVCLVPQCYVNGCGLSIIPENFRKCCSLFTARRTITGKYANWINQKDEYQAPNECTDYEQWNNDAVIYSLFNTASNQSSLRDVEYKGKTWQIKNEWFWLSRQRMIELAEQHRNDAVYHDAKTDNDRFVYTALQGLSLSPDAQSVLDAATALLEDTFEYRERAVDEHPEWQVGTWDAGYYQVVRLAKQFLPDSLKAFRSLYKAFEDRMRDGVYSFGFLKQ